MRTCPTVSSRLEALDPSWKHLLTTLKKVVSLLRYSAVSYIVDPGGFIMSALSLLDFTTTTA
jgi:hypothetical protein